MADFEEIIKHKNWRHMPAAPLLDDRELSSAPYIQDLGRKQKVKPAAPKQISDEHDKYLKGDAACNKRMENSLLWPVDAVSRKDPVPFLVGGSVAFVVVPAVDQSVTFGAAVLAGYGLAVLVNYLKTKDDLQPKKTKIE